MNKKIKVGLIGLGGIMGHAHMPKVFFTNEHSNSRKCYEYGI